MKLPRFQTERGMMVERRSKEAGLHSYRKFSFSMELSFLCFQVQTNSSIPKDGHTKICFPCFSMRVRLPGALYNSRRDVVLRSKASSQIVGCEVGSVVTQALVLPLLVRH